MILVLTIQMYRLCRHIFRALPLCFMTKQICSRTGQAVMSDHEMSVISSYQCIFSLYVNGVRHINVINQRDEVIANHVCRMSPWLALLEHACSFCIHVQSGL